MSASCFLIYPTGNSSRRETKRQTEETMERQHQRVDWPWMEYYTTESREPRGVEEAGCKNLQWCPNGQPDYRIDVEMMMVRFS